MNEREPKDPAVIELESSAEASTDALLELVPTPQAERPARIDGVVIGRVTGFDPAGAPLVAFAAAPAPIAARAATAIGEGDVGREAALLFEGGDPAKPIVMGLLHAPRPVAPLAVESDGERVVLSAEKEITLRCGEASITLTRAGKVLIRGAYVLTRAEGLNRIQGGAVEIN
ncbi:MAG: DUF6484 domain-containing protein [Minicystis sp.]